MRIIDGFLPRVALAAGVSVSTALVSNSANAATMRVRAGVIMRIFKGFTASIALATAALASTALLSFAPAANAATYSFDYVGSDGLTAMGTFDVAGGQAISGTGTITSPLLDSGSTETLTLVTLSTPGVHNLGGGNLSYRFSGGTDLIGDTAFPVDSGGPVFLVSGLGGVGFNFWYDGGTQYEDFLTGFDNAIYQDELGTATFALVATPLPSTWTMLIAGFVGLFGFVAFGGKKRKVAATAAA